ncbi:MAG: 1-(5-phosphoribosyl)-5-[(5-phosphoribosylamino)methylideneamino]imidazole-4-carboxamide isomerase [Eubacteriales bacterium]|nr:1-(5-phosphoribosyl)-5-[(5-phosphoribosylamino)methylideneamino]imidazole-4-carboxamide isomerase [Eubacteriales bacterium]
MLIYPAIDLYEGKAVRLFKGDYAQMTVYSNDPPVLAEDFAGCGATHMHIVDLEGAKTGRTPNMKTILEIKEHGGLFCQVGGGIRSMEVVDRYLGAGLDRVILGTAAVTESGFVERAVEKYGERIAVGIDIKDGFVAIRGWTEKSDWNAFDFCHKMQNIGVKTLICTDISKDGAMSGTNHELYGRLMKSFDMNIIASGGVSSVEDIRRLADVGLYGAIVGKAYYTGSIDLGKAIEVAK